MTANTLRFQTIFLIFCLSLLISPIFNKAFAVPLLDQIAFAVDEVDFGPADVYTMNNDGTGTINLTQTSATTEFAPKVSPDGNQIAFVSDRDDGYEIYTMNPDGSNVVRLTDNPGNNFLGSWSPDGTKLTFFSNQSDPENIFNPSDVVEIYVINGDGTNLQQVTTNNDFDGQPHWSPDGTKILFTSDRDGDNEIYIMNVDGTGVQQITNNSSPDHTPIFSPDGLRIVFTTDRDGNSEIYTMNIDGTNQQNITNNALLDTYPAWSPNGDRIAFSSDRTGQWQIYTMNADGTSLSQLTSNTTRTVAPSWGPQSNAQESFVQQLLELLPVPMDKIPWLKLPSPPRP